MNCMFGRARLLNVMSLASVCIIYILLAINYLNGGIVNRHCVECVAGANCKWRDGVDGLFWSWLVIGGLICEVVLISHLAAKAFSMYRNGGNRVIDIAKSAFIVLTVVLLELARRGIV